MEKKKSSQQIWNEKNKDKIMQLKYDAPYELGFEFKKAVKILGISQADVFKDAIIETIKKVEKNKK